MKAFLRIVMFLNGLVAAAIALECLFLAYPVAWGPKLPTRWLHDLAATPPAAPYLALGGTVLLILNGIAFSRRIFGSYRTKDIELVPGAKDGEVRVRTAAVEELLARVAESNPVVLKARVRVYTQLFRRHRVVCSLSMAESPELHRAVEQVRIRVQERFLAAIPGSARVAVDVSVTEILRDERRSVPLEEAFQGPLYPVGEEILPPRGAPGARKK